jgi:hypothetical protein
MMTALPATYALQAAKMLHGTVTVLKVIQKSVHDWVLNYDKSGGLSLRFATLACVTSEVRNSINSNPASHANRLNYVLR